MKMQKIPASAGKTTYADHLAWSLLRLSVVLVVLMMATVITVSPGLAS